MRRAWCWGEVGAPAVRCGPQLLSVAALRPSLEWLGSAGLGRLRYSTPPLPCLTPPPRQHSPCPRPVWCATVTGKVWRPVSAPAFTSPPPRVVRYCDREGLEAHPRPADARRVGQAGSRQHWYPRGFHLSSARLGRPSTTANPPPCVSTYASSARCASPSLRLRRVLPPPFLLPVCFTCLVAVGLLALLACWSFLSHLDTDPSSGPARGHGRWGHGRWGPRVGGAL